MKESFIPLSWILQYVANNLEGERDRSKGVNELPPPQSSGVPDQPAGK